jgi:hypothetical protein
MEFLLKHYQELVALIGSFMGLLSIGLAFYSKKQDSAIRLSELKLKEEQFVEDKKHQITKSKYQELFTEKIELYIELQNELYDYYDNILILMNGDKIIIQK